ncbi:PqqD family peptide modification chaperone [Candidatus Bathyarchaeota archaeon]|nr:PqqD family peptide modification chaperone [Candidatus Bathyarchaeota archaeon]
MVVRLFKAKPLNLRICLISMGLMSGDILDRIAVRNPELEWSVEPTGEISVTIRRKSFLGPRAKKYVFDEVGSYVLRLLDGRRTLREVAQILAFEKNMDIKQAELSLVSYINQLQSRGAVKLLPAGGSVKTCRDCGREIPSEAIYCPYCGVKHS